MNNVVCECGKTVKGESALAQHKRDSPKHRQSVEPAGTSDPSLSRRRVSNLRVNEYGKPYMSGLDDEDWSLCDKDCAWCGHCADGMGF
ncbi:hypothetical protein FVEG_15769 [Fusarium verticillioides 7600]|uniref:C2H2-type domain-containing protein n=1 Tax=Gibberella moniliformis (strain M3125 / FGSC 7600) TaxID=334819 RepID=W7M080_GIBM7|nr:hypothetical protein FVEG_15769 [Fusarium verticillioides 7600]EWG44998.1 hypothetical protein FVEG_15769 [Fusarium verticillioides 7600]